MGKTWSKEERKYNRKVNKKKNNKKKWLYDDSNRQDSDRKPTKPY